MSVRISHLILHGGASVALAETVASVGSYNLIDQEKCICFGLEINANHIRSKKDGIVTAIGTPIHRGQSTMVWDVRIIDENDDLLCISRCTVAIKEKRENKKRRSYERPLFLIIRTGFSSLRNLLVR